MGWFGKGRDCREAEAAWEGHDRRRGDELTSEDMCEDWNAFVGMLFDGVGLSGADLGCASFG